MSGHSRRTFLKNASIGAAAAGAAAVVPLGVASASAASPASTGAVHKGPFMAWVDDPATGEVTVLVGESKVVVTDRKLARQLASVAARAKTSARKS